MHSTTAICTTNLTFVETWPIKKKAALSGLAVEMGFFVVVVVFFANNDVF